MWFTPREILLILVSVSAPTKHVAKVVIYLQNANDLISLFFNKGVILTFKGVLVAYLQLKSIKSLTNLQPV